MTVGKIMNSGAAGGWFVTGVRCDRPGLWPSFNWQTEDTEERGDRTHSNVEKTLILLLPHIEANGFPMQPLFCTDNTTSWLYEEPHFSPITCTQLCLKPCVEAIQGTTVPILSPLYSSGRLLGWAVDKRKEWNVCPFSSIPGKQRAGYWSCYKDREIRLPF